MKELQGIIEALVVKRLEESLALVEAALVRWRRGELDVLSAHGEVLRLAARAGALSARVTRATVDGRDALLRDAFDAGVVGREEFIRLAGKPPEEVPPPPSLDEDVASDAPAGGRDKRAVLDKLLEEGAVLVHLDARREGVAVPGAHRDDPRLVLRLGHRLTPPIPDLTVDGDGVRATLSFRGAAFGCVLPWSAIYAIVSENGRGLVWPEDMPPEVARDFTPSPDGDGDGGGDGGGGGGDGGGPDRPTPPRRGHLRLV